MLSMYPACFFHENDSYSVIFPDLNYLATQGDTFEEAMEMAVECLAANIKIKRYLQLSCFSFMITALYIFYDLILISNALSC